MRSANQSSVVFGMVILLSYGALLTSCGNEKQEKVYDFEVTFKNDTTRGTMKVVGISGNPEIQLSSKDFANNTGSNTTIDNDSLHTTIGIWDTEYQLKGVFVDDQFQGTFSRNKNNYPFTATLLSDEIIEIDRSGIKYMLASIDADEKDIDHAGIISEWDNQSYQRGSRIYNSNCINCHGNQDIEGSIPLSTKFWKDQFKAGSDTYSMYQTITKGYGSMPPQVTLTPREKYDVLHFIQETYLRPVNKSNYKPNSPGYLAGLPKGKDKGPESKPYHPWSDMDYGNFFMNTYELVDAETGPERYHSPGPSPFPDEDYSTNNFAYKGIAVRVDQGSGGVARGNAWMMFDHDLMRVAGGWTGQGFIDWDGILLNDRHETYPRTIGKLHFETPVRPAWANPTTGTYDDPRFTARDGRQFGPLPKSWADYEGLYHYEDKVIISYSIGGTDVLELFGLETLDGDTVFTRTLNVLSATHDLKSRIATSKNQVDLKSDDNVSIEQVDGYYELSIPKGETAKFKILIANPEIQSFKGIVANSDRAEDLSRFTAGGKPHYPKILTSDVIKGQDDGPFAVDVLTPPFENPWNARMKLSGIDFLDDANIAVACATDGDIWKITGLTDGSDQLKWKRIGSGLFQPLGIKVVKGDIYVTCRDQLVKLHDLNGDEETDFYEAFNHDHQVTDHFHEFAMGLQSDAQGNLYYAKSGRHAREALIPQHGTLIKVSADGSESEIVAKGFRAANGVCINPDGSFIVTDQQGYWNPMNRVNWVEVDENEPKFYGNMWGYDPPKDSSRAGMEPPMVWVDMDFDRSPSELLWVDSKSWGPLDGSLLSFSYGYGKIQLVLNEEVNGQRQGGVIDLPGVKFLTGVMRGRFNPDDGQLYACGMSAWGTSQLMWGGGLYRVRYTGKKLPVPIELNTTKNGVRLTFDPILNKSFAENITNYKIEVWELKRSKKYGSDRHNRRFLKVTNAKISEDRHSVNLTIEGIQPIDVLTIEYDLKDERAASITGKLQNTIHTLGRPRPNS